MGELHGPAAGRPSPPAIVSAALVIGVAAGGSTGLVVGTAILPLIGTAVGGIVGAVVGAGVGVVTGLVLSALSCWTRSVVAARPAAVIVDGSLAALALVRLGHGSHLLFDGRGISFVVWCALVGATFGGRVSDPGRARPSADRGSAPRPGRFASYGAAIGGLVGGIAGVTIGLLVDPATSPFAFLEGAILGAVPGAIVGATASVVCPYRSAGGRP